MHDLNTNRVIIALGGNSSGLGSATKVAFRIALAKIGRLSGDVGITSRLFVTLPHGPGLQAPYFNAVVCVRCSLPPARLLKQLQRIEREAGRRRGVRNGPRPLDLDLIAYGGRVVGWRKAMGRRPTLVLPHPEMHRRAFVLVPLLDVAPHWRHPALGLSARRLLAAAPRVPHDVKAVLDSGWAT